MRYEFLAASQPALHWGARQPMSLQHFLEECKAAMTDTDSGMLESIIMWFQSPPGESQPSSSPSWATPLFEFARSIQLEIGKLRIAQRGQHSHKSGFLPASVISAETPLKAQIAVLQCEWKAVELHDQHDAWAQVSYFVCYGLRLLLLERVSSLNAETGQSVFEALCSVAAKGGEA